MGEVYDAAAWEADRKIGSMLSWLRLSLKRLKTSELKTKLGRRRLRLFLCAAVRRVWHLLDKASRKAVETAELVADGAAEEQTLQAAWGATWPLLGMPGENTPQRRATLAAKLSVEPQLGKALEAVEWTARHVKQDEVFSDGSCCDLLRDLFGNPFRPVKAERRWLTWNGGTLPKMAQSVYDERAYDRLPLLADALEDAGCTDAAILDHCRGPGPHVRGCWVVDLLRGQA